MCQGPRLSGPAWLTASSAWTGGLTGDECGVVSSLYSCVRVGICARLWCGVKRRGILQPTTALCGKTRPASQGEQARLPTCPLEVQRMDTKTARVPLATCSGRSRRCGDSKSRDT